MAAPLQPGEQEALRQPCPASSSLPFRIASNISVRRAGIIIKKEHGPADSFADMLGRWLQDKGISTTINQIDPDLDILIIAGGDGTLLHVAAQAARHSIPVIGINLGNLGFLTELTEPEAIQALEEIISSAVTVENRMMLKARIIRDNQPTEYRYALK